MQIASCFVHRSDNSTRGNQLKLYKCHCTVDVTKHYFTNRVVIVWNSLQDTVVTVCYLFVVSWLNSIRVVFVLIFNFRFFFSYIYFFCIIAIVLTVFFVYFIGVSGLRVLPLSINGWISSLIHHLFIYCIKYR